MLSLSVVYDQGLEGAAVVEAVRGAGLGELSFELVDQGGLTGRLAWTTVDGRGVGVLLVDRPLDGPEVADAVAHSRWAEAQGVLTRQRAHAKVFAEDDGASPLERLYASTRVASALLGLPGALGLLTDEGRALNSRDFALKRMDELKGRTPPLDLWVGVRYFPMADSAGYFMDTIGMAQLGLPDLEAYAGAHLRTDAVAGWLRNLSLYLLQHGAEIHSGETLDGPDEQPWVAKEDEATVEPPRNVVRMRKVPAELEE
jgi:hypothetical protein